MFFKNKTTGLIWEVTQPDHIKRCQNDDNYEEVKAVKKEADKPKPTKKTSQKKSSKAGA